MRFYTCVTSHEKTYLNYFDYLPHPELSPNSFLEDVSGWRSIVNIVTMAAKALGVSRFTQFNKIILPQMLRLAIPNLINVWQITLKDTSLISVTGLVEIMRQSYIAAGSTRDPLFFYCFAAILYLMLTYISMKIINRLEIKYSRGY